MTTHIGPKFRHGIHRALQRDILRDSPHAYWLCDEASGTTVYDYSGNGYDLTITGTAGTQYELQGAALLHDGTRFLTTFSGATISRSGAMGLTVPMDYDWSACWLWRREDASIANYVLSLMSAGETEATNAQVELVTQSTDNFMRIGWESGAGVNTILASVPAGRTYGTYLVHAVKDTAAKEVRLYLDGRFVWSDPYVNEPTGGTNISTYLGCDANSTALAKTIGHVALFPGQMLSERRISSHAASAGRGARI